MKGRVFDKYRVHIRVFICDKCQGNRRLVLNRKDVLRILRKTIFTAGNEERLFHSCKPQSCNGGRGRLHPFSFD